MALTSNPMLFHPQVKSGEVGSTYWTSIRQAECKETWASHGPKRVMRGAEGSWRTEEENKRANKAHRRF